MEYPIPETSLNRLRQAYASFDQLCMVIAEAMGLDVQQQFQIDLPNGRFLTPDPPAMHNGIAARSDLGEPAPAE